MPVVAIVLLMTFLIVSIAIIMRFIDYNNFITIANKLLGNKVAGNVLANSVIVY